jgi:hypothetical protein
MNLLWASGSLSTLLRRCADSRASILFRSMLPARRRCWSVHGYERLQTAKANWPTFGEALVLLIGGGQRRMVHDSTTTEQSLANTSPLNGGLCREVWFEPRAGRVASPVTGTAIGRDRLNCCYSSPAHAVLQRLRRWRVTDGRSCKDKARNECNSGRSRPTRPISLRSTGRAVGLGAR